ncbi:STAS domain-containing protein [Nocardioides jensenii]|uniref:STAS domain-containing protein n=1 Tax=Nocardioides jensenii TaxID=1843 RepID=UPI0008366459|nr:STAS domain-containing protein [Nocardioides jensenii]
MTALEVHTTHEPSSCTISVIGPVIACNIVKLRDHMHALFARTPALNAYLDLGCCTYIDLDGLFFLANVRDELARAGGTMRLVHTPPLIVRLLRQHNFDDLIDTDPHDQVDGETKGPKAKTSLSQGPVTRHNPD